MVRSGSHEIGYDVIIADIRLPDMSGYELLIKLKEVMPQVPLVLMSGFGYDPGHSIVKARQAGLNSSAVLYKPFRLGPVAGDRGGNVKSSVRSTPGLTRGVSIFFTRGSDSRPFP